MYHVDTYLQNTDRYDIGKKSLYRNWRRIKSSGVIPPKGDKEVKRND